MRLISLLVGSLILAGCASTPKPVMTDNVYIALASGWVTADRCGTQGDMDPVTAAYAKERIQQEMYSYSFDSSQMNGSIAYHQNHIGVVSKEDCNKVSMYFAGLRDEYNRNSTGSSSNKSSQASCYTTPYGNVTNCVSY